MQVSVFPLSAMFGMCSLFLLVASLCQRRLDTIVTKEQALQKSEQGEVSSLLSSVSAGADKAAATV